MRAFATSFLQNTSMLVVLSTIVCGGCGGSTSSRKERDCLHVLSGHSDYICSVVLSSNGKQLVSGGADGKIKFWDIQSGSCERTIDGHIGSVHSVVFSPDNQFIASGGRDPLVKLWKVETGELQKEFKGHKGLVRSVAYSPNGQLLASCGSDKKIKIWEVASCKCLKSFDPDDVFSATAVQFSFDSRQVLVGGDSLQWWDVETGKCLLTFRGHSDSVGGAILSRDGKWIASAGSFTDVTIRVWDAKTGSLIWKKDMTRQQGGGWSLAFVLDDSVLVSGHRDGTLRYWAVKDGTELRTVKAHSQIVSALAADSKGQHLISGSWDKSIKLWKVSLDQSTK